jgi:hypothetical protein
MEFFFLLLTILGLCVFEIVSSVDNAIINAEVLSTMQEKAKKWFLSWGILLAVFVMRGILPWAVVWIANPGLGLIGALTATFTQDKEAIRGLTQSFEILLTLGGTFLVFLFLHWIFIEPKNFGLKGERFLQSQGAWFYTIASIILAFLVSIGINDHPARTLGVVLGSTIFFITHGFRQYAEQQELKLKSEGGKSDISKLLYLEAIDASFSIDGVFGAFAFTFSVPLIFLGNGIGAIVLRYLTVSSIHRIKKYKYLKNGAMYSILALGVIMLLEGYGFKVPSGISPVVTLFAIGYFYLKSKSELT